MSDVDEKLIVKPGQRIVEQTEILRMIAASLQGVEARLRQMTISSNTAPNYQRLLSEYPNDERFYEETVYNEEYYVEQEHELIRRSNLGLELEELEERRIRETREEELLRPTLVKPGESKVEDDAQASLDMSELPF